VSFITRLYNCSGAIEKSFSRSRRHRCSHRPKLSNTEPYLTHHQCVSTYRWSNLLICSWLWECRCTSVGQLLQHAKTLPTDWISQLQLWNAISTTGASASIQRCLHSTPLCQFHGHFVTFVILTIMLQGWFGSSKLQYWLERGENCLPENVDWCRLLSSFERLTLIKLILVCVLPSSVVAYGNDRYLLAQSTKFGKCIA